MSNLVLAQLAWEVKRLKGISERQSKHLAQALLEKNEAKAKLWWAERAANDSTYFKNRLGEAQSTVSELEKKLVEVRKAFRTLQAL